MVATTEHGFKREFLLKPPIYLNKRFRNFHLRVSGIFTGKEKQVEKKEAPEELPKREVEKPSKQVKEPPVQEEEEEEEGGTEEESEEESDESDSESESESGRLCLHFNALRNRKNQMIQNLVNFAFMLIF